MTIRARITFVFIVLLAAAAQAASTTRPNIVVILADDLGYSDAGCFGGEILTPNIDHLAATGVRFTQFYNNAWCCPSRASLMTGRYPHQVGIGAMIDPYAKWVRDAANTPAYADHLSKDSPTMPELLRSAGYRTMMVGKWHLGYRPEEWPAARGFDDSFALVGGAMNYFGSETGGKPALMVMGGEKYVPPAEGFYSTDAFTNRAVNYINSAAKSDKPFFLYLAYNAPHWPLQAHADDIKRHLNDYKAGWQPIRDKRFARMREMGVIDKTVEMTPMDRGNFNAWEDMPPAKRDEWALRMSVYSAMVETMDRGIGQVMSALRTSGAESNTLVLFLSDNGGAAEDPNRGTGPIGTRDSFRGYARPWATVSNTPLKYHKVTIYEGGISAPMIAHWPEGIPADRNATFVRQPAHLIDLLPSFLELAGAPHDDRFKPEGESIVKMMKGAEGNADRTFAWEHEGHRGIRKGKWKLVRLSDASKWDLYDIETDRAEQHNLAFQHPEIVADLSKAYDEWATRCGVVPFEKIASKRPANPPEK